MTTRPGYGTVIRTGLLALLVASACSVESPTFLSDWDRDPAKGGWMLNQVMTGSRLYRDATVRTQHGRAAAKVVVAPGDDPINSSGERSEVLFMKGADGRNITESAASGTQHYATSYRVPADWRPGQGWSIVFQIHGPDSLGLSPSFALNLNSAYSVNIMGGDFNVTGWAGNKRYAFTGDSSLNAGRWSDFVMRIRWAATPTGSVTVWRRNEGATGFSKVLEVANVATLQYKGDIATVGPHYWKQGLYRGESPGITNTLWMGPLSRAPSFLAAEHAAFGTMSGESTGATSPSITAQPTSRSVTVGQTATFSTSATGTAPLAYQWQRNGASISGATSASYTTPPAALADNGATFRCVVSNGAGTATSSAATLTVTSGSGLPAGWVSRDVGSVGPAGSTAHANGVFTVRGSGADIVGSVDAFQFVSQPLTGDGSIVARVASLQHTDPWAKAGVMIREGTAAGAKHAFCFATAANGVAFQRRTATSGTTSQTRGSLSPAPRWVKLVRRSTTITAYESADGASWTTLGSTTIGMANPVQFGLAVTSHNNAVLCTAVFDHVVVTPGGSG